MGWVLLAIVVFVLYNAEKLPDMIKNIKKEVPHLADVSKKAAQDLKEKAKSVQEKAASKKKTSSKNENTEE